MYMNITKYFFFFFSLIFLSFIRHETRIHKSKQPISNTQTQEIKKFAFRRKVIFLLGAIVKIESDINEKFTPKRN